MKNLFKGLFSKKTKQEHKEDVYQHEYIFQRLGNEVRGIWHDNELMPLKHKGLAILEAVALEHDGKIVHGEERAHVINRKVEVDEEGGTKKMIALVQIW